MTKWLSARNIPTLNARLVNEGWTLVKHDDGTWQGRNADGRFTGTHYKPGRCISEMTVYPIPNQEERQAMPIKIEQDLASMYKYVFIYDEASNDNQSCIVIRKNPKNHKADTSVWAAATILIQSQSITPAYISFMIQALEVAKDVAERLEKEYPTGEKVNKEK